MCINVKKAPETIDIIIRQLFAEGELIDNRIKNRIVHSGGSEMENRIQYVKGDRIWLKDHPEFDESWLQNIIANDPSILGFGDLILRETERIQLKAGRLNRTDDEEK